MVQQFSTRFDKKNDVLFSNMLKLLQFSGQTIKVLVRNMGISCLERHCKRVLLRQTTPLCGTRLKTVLKHTLFQSNLAGPKIWI